MHSFLQMKKSFTNIEERLGKIEEEIASIKEEKIQAAKKRERALRFLWKNSISMLFKSNPKASASDQFRFFEQFAEKNQ